MLGCRFNFKEYAKNVERKRPYTENILKFYWMLMDMCLPKFDIYQGTIAPNC